MNVQQAIEELKAILHNTVSETKVRDEITVRLASLRKAYAANKSSFTQADIVFLKSLKQVSDDLQEFIDVLDEIKEFDKLEYFEELKKKPELLRNRLAGFAVEKRIKKELRGLAEKLPQLYAQEEMTQRSRETARIRELEREAPRCPRKHLMEIKEGEKGYFWGCTKFPACFFSKQLTKQERNILNGVD